MTTFELTLNTQQLALVDAHVGAGRLANRSALAARALAEATPMPRFGRKPPRSPQPASKRQGRVVVDHVIGPGTGKAVLVPQGSILRVEQILGGQCADFNIFCLDNWHEHLHLGRTRSLHGNRPSTGDLVWSRAPWERPLMAILANTSQTDALVPYCSALLYWRLFGRRRHTNCQQIQIEAQREFGLPPYAVHESLNLFMYVDQDSDGVPVIRPNRAGPEDFIELFAYRDVVASVNVCGDDMGVTNNFELRDLRLVVLESTDDDQALAMTLLGRDHPTGLLPQPYDIPAAPLVADPTYEPRYPHAPVAVETLAIELDRDDTNRLEALAKTELYGDDLAASLRDLIMTWVAGQPRVEEEA